MSPELTLVFWWLAFGATHMGMSAIPLRGRLVAALGERGFLGIYSLVSFVTFVPLVWTYIAHRHQGLLLIPLAHLPAIHAFALALAWISFASAIGGVFQPSALSLVAGGTPRARGMGRITRHPLFMSLGVWATAHLLVNGFLTDVMFFGGFALFCVIGCAHQDARKRAVRGDELEQYFAETSLLPFGAILSGRNRLAWSELPWLGLGVGAALATTIYLLHPWMFAV
jgi:uncharacterized membrane protein